MRLLHCTEDGYELWRPTTNGSKEMVPVGVGSTSVPAVCHTDGAWSDGAKTVCMPTRTTTTRTSTTTTATSVLASSSLCSSMSCLVCYLPKVVFIAFILCHWSSRSLPLSLSQGAGPRRDSNETIQVRPCCRVARGDACARATVAVWQCCTCSCNALTLAVWTTFLGVAVSTHCS